MFNSVCSIVYTAAAAGSNRQKNAIMRTSVITATRASIMTRSYYSSSWTSSLLACIRTKNKYSYWNDKVARIRLLSTTPSNTAPTTKYYYRSWNNYYDTRKVSGVVGVAGTTLLTGALYYHYYFNNNENISLFCQRDNTTNYGKNITYLDAAGSTNKTRTITPVETKHDDNNDKKDNLFVLDSWKSRWKNGITRWHRSDVHPKLVQYMDKLFSDVDSDNNTNKHYQILVPLCGKTVDMAFLANHPSNKYHVVGVDCCNIAFAQFVTEHPELYIKRIRNIPNIYEEYNGKNINLFCYNFFQLDTLLDSLNTNQHHNTMFDVIWDRASLVAIQPSLREEYVRIIGNVITKPGGKYLLSAHVRGDDEKGDKMKGPPFSIDENEVHRLFAHQPWVDKIELLEVGSMLANEPSWYKKISLWYRFGSAKELIFLITTK